MSELNINQFCAAAVHTVGKLDPGPFESENCIQWLLPSFSGSDSLWNSANKQSLRFFSFPVFQSPILQARWRQLQALQRGRLRRAETTSLETCLEATKRLLQNQKNQKMEYWAALGKCLATCLGGPGFKQIKEKEYRSIYNSNCLRIMNCSWWALNQQVRNQDTIEHRLEWLIILWHFQLILKDVCNSKSSLQKQCNCDPPLHQCCQKK